MTVDKSRARYNCAKKFPSEELSSKAPSNHSILISVFKSARLKPNKTKVGTKMIEQLRAHSLTYKTFKTYSVFKTIHSKNMKNRQRPIYSYVVASNIY